MSPQVGPGLAASSYGLSRNHISNSRLLVAGVKRPLYSPQGEVDEGLSSNKGLAFFCMYVFPPARSYVSLLLFKGPLYYDFNLGSWREQ